MRKHTFKLTGLLVLVTLFISACGIIPAIQTGITGAVDDVVTDTKSQTTAGPETEIQLGDVGGLLAAYEGALENVYTQVNPSVVNIQVVQQGSLSDFGEMPFGFDIPEEDIPDQFSQGLGSGFVWDKQGHIVTNNHVVEGANQIEVIFSDGTTLPATLVGADAYSDLAVIKVDADSDLLKPVQMADSSQVRVGGLAIAIGNPYGLDGTMTVGIISAIGRTLPASAGFASGAYYSIPNIIQTDAPINPGNSGGVLVDEMGQVVGVTTAIESSSGSNAGIGFVVPANIVSKVVPALIETGVYEHPYLGISGTDLTSDMAEAMGLASGQRGVLVMTATEDGPAARAGLRASEDITTANGQEMPSGGDVIIAINEQPVKEMDELIAYLSDSTEVGQTVELTVLREGREMALDVTLAARPSATSIAAVEENLPETETQPEEEIVPSGNTWLGIMGSELTSEIAVAMDLPENQQGVLVVQVESGSPADAADLQASDQQITINGQTVMVGGDVITAVDGSPVISLDELRNLLQSYRPGTEVQLSLLRNGEAIEVSVTLVERPDFIP